ncbi:hypothetical protein [Pseudomonas sp. TWP3-2]|uniref:hypothetical protein n=1 Tax=Pseudomonas sp. TWP3-2 TaxID=2804574 RepID=UPI003CEAEE66
MKGRIFSEEDLARLPESMTRRALGKKPAVGKAVPEHLRMAGDEPKKSGSNGGMKAMQALGRLEAGELNKTEEAYRAHLEMRRMAGEILWYQFEPFRLVLAAKTTYAPDFLVQLASGHLEVHEVKGHWMEDARIKIKVAAKMFPVFKFIAVMKEGGSKGRDVSWKVEEF